MAISNSNKLNSCEPALAYRALQTGRLDKLDDFTAYMWSVLQVFSPSNQHVATEALQLSPYTP